MCVCEKEPSLFIVSPKKNKQPHKPCPRSFALFLPSLTIISNMVAQFRVSNQYRPAPLLPLPKPTLTEHECNRNNLFFIRTYVRTFHGWELPSSTVFGESPRCGHSACMRAPVPSPARDDKYIVFRFRSPRRTLPSQVLPILYALVRHSPILRCVLFQDHAHIHAQKDTRSNKPRTNKQKRLPK